MKQDTREDELYNRGYRDGYAGATMGGPMTFFSFWGVVLFFVTIAAAIPIIGYYGGLWYSYWGF